MKKRQNKKNWKKFVRFAQIKIIEKCKEIDICEGIDFMAEGIGCRK